VLSDHVPVIGVRTFQGAIDALQRATGNAA
jgi:hypothetical protein